jgi:hypothetical protein
LGLGFDGQQDECKVISIINNRSIAGNAKKAQVAAAKKEKADQEKEKNETQKWKTGAKDDSRKQEAETKRLEGN